jgi:predicted lipoprotein
LKSELCIQQCQYFVPHRLDDLLRGIYHDNQHSHQHKYLYTKQEVADMKLSEVANDLEQRRIELLKSNTEIAKQQAAYAKSAQAWYQLQKAQAEEVKARQRFIQAAQAFSRSSHP